MELNLYGVASIQLDKMRGGQIKKILLKALICKLISLTIHSICCHCYDVLFSTQGSQCHSCKLRRIRNFYCKVMSACVQSLQNLYRHSSSQIRAFSKFQILTLQDQSFKSKKNLEVQFSFYQPMTGIFFPENRMETCDFGDGTWTKVVD
jgi:hypothetical protein